MVDHLTRVVVERQEPHADALVAALRARGFEISARGHRIVADSTAVEAQEAKRALRAAGVPDRAYRIQLEYVRQWGVL